MNSFSKTVALGALALIILLGVAGWTAGWRGVRAQEPTRSKKVVFWAGPKEHGAPGRHEYERDLTELAWQLEHATNLHGVKAVVKVVTKPPRDISELERAERGKVNENVPLQFFTVQHCEDNRFSSCLDAVEIRGVICIRHRHARKRVRRGCCGCLKDGFLTSAVTFLSLKKPSEGRGIPHRDNTKVMRGPP